MAKNKQKTRKSAAKRFKVSPKGKVLNRAQGFRHLRGKKNKKWLEVFTKMLDPKNLIQEKWLL